MWILHLQNLGDFDAHVYMISVQESFDKGNRIKKFNV